MPAGERSNQSGARGGYAGGPVTGVRPPVTPIYNSIRSKEKENDWTIFDALKTGILTEQFPESIDLREEDWHNDIVWQGETSSCVAWASTDSMFRWHLIKAGRLEQKQYLSARFTWMASKETDKFADFPETFIEKAGTPLKASLNVLKKYGCVLEEDFPFNNTMVNNISTNDFYTKAAQFCIKSYYSMVIDEKPNVDHLRMWISQQGPIMVMSDLDTNFLNLYDGKTTLDVYDKQSVAPDSGHAFALVGYTADHFIIRNSWGNQWGDKGCAYATNQYITDAICEGYGICI